MTLYALLPYSGSHELEILKKYFIFSLGAGPQKRGACGICHTCHYVNPALNTKTRNTDKRHDLQGQRSRSQDHVMRLNFKTATPIELALSTATARYKGF